MTTLREAAQQALEYMKSVGQMDMYPEDWAIVGRLEAALAQQAYTDDLNQRIKLYVGSRLGPAQEPVAVPLIDYEALIAAAYAANKKWAQGTSGCVAFRHGAEWFRSQTLAAPPQQAEQQTLV